MPERTTEVFYRSPRNEVWKHTEVKGHWVAIVNDINGRVQAQRPKSTLKYFSSPFKAVYNAKCFEKHGPHTFTIKENLSKSPFNKLASTAAHTVKELAGSYILRKRKSTMDTTTLELAIDGVIQCTFRNDRQPGNAAPHQEVGETTSVVTRVAIPTSSAKIEFIVDGNAVLVSSGGGEVPVVE